jgi:hypothetical protein
MPTSQQELTTLNHAHRGAALLVHNECMLLNASECAERLESRLATRRLFYFQNHFSDPFQ